MPGQAGTLETLAAQVGLILQPLADQLTPANIISFLAELGLQFPPELLNQAGFTNALATGSADAGALPQLLSQLATDIANGDEAGIATAGAQLIQKIAAVIGSLEQIGTELSNAAGALPGMNATEVTAFAENLASNLLSFLVISYLENLAPGVVGVANLLGALDYIPEPGVAGDPTHPAYTERTLHLSNLGKLLTSPDQLMRSLTGWGDPSFDGTLLIPRLNTSLNLLGLTSQIVTPGPGNALQATLVSIAVNPGTSPPGLLATLNYPIADGFAITLPLTAVWSVQISTQGTFDAGLEATLTPTDTVSLKPPTGSLTGQLMSILTATAPDPASPIIILGQTGGSRLQVSSFTFGMGLTATWDSASGTASADPVIQLGVTGGEAVIDMSQADGFLSAIMSGSDVQAAFALQASWSAGKGLHVSGGGQLEIDIPLQVDLGPVSLDMFHVIGALAGSGLTIEASVGLAATLGPVSAAVDRLGMLATVSFPDSGGNLGVADLSVAFKPPTGIGISIDAGLVAGGGYITFDPAHGRYAGILAVTLADTIAVQVIAVLDTKLPDGSDGYSLLFVITFELPPIQLGFGFTLTGVGGLGGVDRTMVQDALRAGLRAHALNAILFPPDPIDNAPQIISDIESFFPPQQGRYLFGPMLSIGWGTPVLLDFEVGVILEVPDPVRLAILGEVTATIPDPDLALLSFKIDVLGTIDFGLDQMAIDGTMYDSYVLAFQISGDMAFRLNWGDNPAFLFSLGGFNPTFQPPPGVPALSRLTVSLGSGSNPRLSASSYFAVTSNTLQFGANVSAYASAGGFSVQGHIGFDALFIFSPFSFEIDFSAGFNISYDGASLAGIQLNASLSGPRPWHLHGSASFNILFFSVSASLDLTWGDSTPATLPSQPVLPPLLAALGDGRNWSVALPPSSMQIATLRSIPPQQTAIVVHPLGSLRVRETVVPLDIPITMFDSATPADGTEFGISGVTLNGTAAAITPLDEDFAIAQFTTMSDADKLSAPSYEPFHAGVVLGAEPIANGRDAARTVTYVELYIDDYRAVSRAGGLYDMPASVHDALVGSGLGYRVPTATTGLAAYRTPDVASPISVQPMTWAVASTTDLSPRTDIIPPGATHYEAVTAMRTYLAANPGEQTAVQVVATQKLAS
jgi:hypothetical protein